MSNSLGLDSHTGALVDEEQRVRAGMRQLGQVVRRCREEAGLTPDDLCASTSHLNPDALIAIEIGNRCASVTVLREIGGVLNMDPAAMMHNIYPWDECATCHAS